ncbi:MAG TPA: hypothetical protein VMR16_04005 [Candidatus Saccharimonadales bacterium]|nr:hypothetical protein [Candidatus Saccharimonadales bacterium]
MKQYIKDDLPHEFGDANNWISSPLDAPDCYAVPFINFCNQRRKQDSAFKTAELVSAYTCAYGMVFIGRFTKPGSVPGAKWGDKVVPFVVMLYNVDCSFRYFEYKAVDFSPFKDINGIMPDNFHFKP